MKKLYFIGFSLLAVLYSCKNENVLTESNSATAEHPKGDPNAPAAAITFDEEEKTMPEINEGEQLTIMFSFTNTGKAPLIVTQAKGSCGCTSTDYEPKDQIAPGEKGTIRAIFDSSGKPKNNTKTITVSSNDPSGDKTLTFHVFVNPTAQE